MVEWSRAFGGAPMYLPSADREHVQYLDERIVWWEGRRELVPGVTLVQCGGHFDGSAVLHWSDGAEGRGALLVGDTITVVPDVRFVSFMRSYPNHIPLPAEAVRRIVAAIKPYRYARIYGGWWDRVVREDGPRAVERSADRYLRWIGASPAGS
jgi:glyoxylase-like metal-dependent hydrolase (beta-lactamase superfamily II)